MLWTFFTILVFLWLLGTVSGYTTQEFVHILLAMAIVVVIIRSSNWLRKAIKPNKNPEGMWWISLDEC